MEIRPVVLEGRVVRLEPLSMDHHPALCEVGLDPRDYAELREAVVVVGLLNHIEIWSRANWQIERALAEQERSQLAEHLFALGV